MERNALHVTVILNEVKNLRRYQGKYGAQCIAPYTIKQQKLEKALSCSTEPWLLGFL